MLASRFGKLIIKNSNTIASLPNRILTSHDCKPATSDYYLINNQQIRHESTHFQENSIEQSNEYKLKCTLIPGDGVGPELCAAVREVLSAISVPIHLEEYYISEIHPSMSVPLETVVRSIKENGISLKGSLSSPETNTTGDAQTLNMKLRKQLDLFANVVHIRSLKGVKTKHPGLDFLVIREQTEGEYSALEHVSVPGVVECLKIITEQKSRRIAKFAFDYATKHMRKKVTCVHKANIMKLGDGLFLKCCQETSELYPQIEFESMIIDNTCMQLVSHPQQFDVMVMPNLYGNIIDNLSAGLVGGAGMVPGASYSSESVIFEPVSIIGNNNKILLS